MWADAKKGVRFDAVHGHQLKQVIGIRYPQQICSSALYKRCKCGPMSFTAINARWGLFGHVMRMAHDTLAQMPMDEHKASTDTARWQGRPRTTLPITLDNYLQGIGKRLRNKKDLQDLRIFSKDRNQWRNL